MSSIEENNSENPESTKTKLASNFEKLERDFWKYQTGNKTQGQIQSRSAGAEEDRSKNHVTSEADELIFTFETLENDFRKYQTRNNSQEVSYKEVEEEGENKTTLLDRQYVNSPTKSEDQGLSEMKLHKQGSLAEYDKRSKSKPEERNFNFTNNRLNSSGKLVLEDREDRVMALDVPVEQIQRANRIKGNEELNNELKFKANELEKLFAEHKYNIKQTTEVQHVLCRENMRTSSIMSSYNVTSSVTSSDKRSYGESLRNNFCELGLSDDCRGKFYDKYAQKRNAKLREEWGSYGAEKEAKMKAMQDSFEQSREEMEAKFAGSIMRREQFKLRALQSWGFLLLLY